MLCHSRRGKLAHPSHFLLLVTCLAPCIDHHSLRLLSHGAEPCHTFPVSSDQASKSGWQRKTGELGFLPDCWLTCGCFTILTDPGQLFPWCFGGTVWGKGGKRIGYDHWLWVWWRRSFMSAQTNAGCQSAGKQPLQSTQREASSHLWLNTTLGSRSSCVYEV